MTKSKVIAFIVLVVAVISLVLLVAYAPASAADYPANVTITHAFKDTAGNTEVGPLLVKLYSVAGDVLKSQLSITGPVTNQAMPGFVVTVPNNVTTNVQFYAIATDPAGNASAKGMSNIVAVMGLDTIPPATINVNITITQ